MTHPAPRLAEHFSPLRIAVLGDLIVDRTRWVTADRLDDAGFPIWRERETTDQPGGAAYVATLVQSFGCDVDLYGLVGSDPEGVRLLQELGGMGIRRFTHCDPARPTTLKERVATDSQGMPRSLGRLDRESTRPIDSRAQHQFLESFRAQAEGYAGVVISDYAKGVCTPELVRDVLHMSERASIPVIVDPARKTDYRHLTGCDLVTPNRGEAEVMSGMPIGSRSAAADAGQQICRQTGAGACAITLDAEGLLLTDALGHHTSYPASRVPNVDPTGAGDALVAAVAYLLASGWSLTESLRVANHVAGRQIGRFGTCRLARADLETGIASLRGSGSAAKLLALESLDKVVRSLRQSGRRIVLTNGCFDLLHPGHVGYLEQAAAEGECLIVAVNADQTVSALKGPDRPIIPVGDRAKMLTALACVDFVVVFNEPTPHEVIRRLQPDVLVKGGDYSPQEVVGRELVESYGGIVRTMPLMPGWSTTRVLERLATRTSSVGDAG